MLLLNIPHSCLVTILIYTLPMFHRMHANVVQSCRANSCKSRKWTGGGSLECHSAEPKTKSTTSITFSVKSERICHGLREIYANTLLGKLLEFILIAFFFYFTGNLIRLLWVSAERVCLCLCTSFGRFRQQRTLCYCRAQHKNFHIAFDTSALQNTKVKSIRITSESTKRHKHNVCHSVCLPSSSKNAQRYPRAKCKRHPTRTQREWNSFDNKKKAKTQIQTKDAKIRPVWRGARNFVRCSCHSLCISFTVRHEFIWNTINYNTTSG